MPDPEPSPDSDPAALFPFEYRPPDEGAVRWHAVRSMRRGGVFLVVLAAGLAALHAAGVPFWGLGLAFLAAAIAYPPLGRRLAQGDHLRWIRSRAKEWERERSTRR